MASDRTRPTPTPVLPEDESSVLREYALVLWRRKWMILAVVAVCTVAAYLVSTSRPDRYQATTSLLYESSLDVSNPLSVYGGANIYTRDVEMRATSAILASPDLRQRALPIIEKTYPEVAGATRGGESFSVTAITPKQETSSQSVGSDILSVVGTSANPRLAAAAANGYAQAFIEWRQERQRAQIGMAIKVVEGQMGKYSSEAKQTADYLTLQQRLRDLQILSGTATGNYSVLVPAVAPAAPFEPKPARTAVLGLGIGLFLSIGVAFVLEQVGTKLRRQEEVAAILRQPILGRIPRLTRKALEDGGLVTLTHPESHAAEAFRVIRTNLDFMAVDASLHSILFTSCMQGEGKSISVANLAVAVAFAGKSVVVVDADLRRPQQARLFGISNDMGVSMVATGRAELDDALVPIEFHHPMAIDNDDAAIWTASSEARPRVSVLPSGPIPPNPGEIVSSRRFGEIIERLATQVDLVIVDTPAMLAVGDTAAIAAKVDGLVFLVDTEIVRRPVLRQAAEQLSKLPIQLLGTVVRTASTSGTRYGYYAYGYAEPAGSGHRRMGRRERGASQNAASSRGRTPTA
jgi:Mrp family chromosome partitioning ATPase